MLENFLIAFTLVATIIIPLWILGMYYFGTHPDQHWHWPFTH